MSDHSKVADGAAITTWIAYFFSHLTETNAVLQFISLIIALISGIYALLYHAKRFKQIQNK